MTLHPNPYLPQDSFTKSSRQHRRDWLDAKRRLVILRRKLFQRRIDQDGEDFNKNPKYFPIPLDK